MSVLFTLTTTLCPLLASTPQHNTPKLPPGTLVPTAAAIAARKFLNRRPEQGVPADAAYQLVHDELNMEANPALNRASFVTTWMEPEAVKLMQENLPKNFMTLTSTHRQR